MVKEKASFKRVGQMGIRGGSEGGGGGAFGGGGGVPANIYRQYVCVLRGGKS